MLVKAKWNVKCSDGWHMTGEVFQTKEDLWDAVEVLDSPKQPESVKAEETVKEEKPRVSPRRKKVSE